MRLVQSPRLDQSGSLIDFDFYAFGGGDDDDAGGVAGGGDDLKVEFGGDCDGNGRFSSKQPMRSEAVTYIDKELLSG